MKRGGGGAEQHGGGMTLGSGWKLGPQLYHGLKEPSVVGAPLGDGKKSRVI